MMRAASEELLRSRSQSPLPAKKQPRKTARWTTLSAAVLVQSVAGLSYIFSLYSSTLKAKFHLPQTQLDLLGTLSNVGATVGLHMGMLTDRVGPRPVVALGACLGVAGWLPLWAALDGWRCPYAVLCVLHLLQGQMALTLDVPIVSSTGRAFPEHRGLALGLVKSYVGLSGSLATLAYQAAFRPRVAPFVLAIALANVAFAAVYLAATARNADAPEPGRDAETRAAAARGLAVALGLTGFLAFSLVAAALAMQFSSAAAAGTGRVALGALVAAIFCCVLAFLRSRADPDPGAKASALEAPLLSEEPRASDAPDFAFLDAIRTKDFCILFVAFVCSSGPGLILINNLGQIVPAVPSLPEGTEDAFVSILSVCNCLGRLSAGALGDHLLAARGAPRPATLAFFCALTAAAMGLLAIGTPASLYGAVVVGGYAYGGLNGGIVPCYSEIWGFASFASLYSAGSLAEGAASYLMATLLFGSLYQREIKSQGLAASATCVGRGCFLNAALVAAALAAFATLLCVVLAVRSRARYAALYPHFFRNGAIQ